MNIEMLKFCVLFLKDDMNFGFGYFFLKSFVDINLYIFSLGKLMVEIFVEIGVINDVFNWFYLFWRVDMFVRMMVIVKLF